MPNEEVEYARRVSIHTILGIKNTRRTSIKCVFHTDSTPSLVIYPDNHYYCFGCGATGQNAIDFTMKLGYSFKDAVKELQDYVH